jgi:signal transduction histidine kinase
VQTTSEIKILVVDDREDNLFSIETILEKDNYVITKANSGRAALKILLQQQDFSLILMDVQMPGMNGFETAALIYERDKLKNIPIIFITAHSQEDEYIFKGYKTGGVDYIYKPINPDLLKIKVNIFVELYRKNLQLQVHEQKLLAANASLQRQIEERRSSEEKVRELNEQLMKNNSYLKAVNEELDRFAFVASHDLQEPLRKIRVFSDMVLRKNSFMGDEDKYMKKIIDSSRRMQQLINDILQFSRHHAGAEDFIETDMAILVADVINELEVKVAETNATINIHKLPVLSVIPVLIRQLFFNLVSNALKFRKISEPLVINIHSEKMDTVHSTAARKLHSNGSYYKIIVADNGIGFDDKYAEEIFMVFKRLHSYHEFEGTGMGLSICKRIVEKHNGSISATGKIGDGAAFIIELPETQSPVVGKKDAAAFLW